MAIDYESILQAAYEAILRPGDIAVDVGAHLGRHTVPMARRVLPGGRVFAFEPLPMLQAGLARHLKALLRKDAQAVTLHACALSHYEGKGEFVVAKDALGFSGLRERPYDIPMETERIEVPIRKLDAVLPDLPSLQYIKVDTEGGDFHVVQGAEAILRKHRPVVSFEFGFNVASRYGVTPRHVADLFAQLGYRLMEVTGGDVTHPDDFERSARAQVVWDYLAVPKEKEALRVRMLAAIEAQRRALDAPVAKDIYRSNLVLRAHVSREAPQLCLAVKNVSAATWPANGGEGAIRVGTIWFAAGRTDVRLAEHRAELPLPMEPGDEAEVEVPLEPIGYDRQRLPPGQYQVCVGLVQELVAWFQDRGDGVLWLQVAVDD